MVREKVLVVSFLYPDEYYFNILERLIDLREAEYDIDPRTLRPRMMVMQLYPGYLRPNDLFNRITWELDAAELHGDPYSSVVIDGIHNVYLQFPEIERYQLFWPQLYAALRSRPITIITTHTTLVVPGTASEGDYWVDNARSEPLRHALVQKTDFQFEIDFVKTDSEPQQSRPPERAPEDPTSVTMEPNTFAVRTLSAINQPIPRYSVRWSREKLILFDSPGIDQTASRDTASTRSPRAEEDSRQLRFLNLPDTR